VKAIFISSIASGIGTKSLIWFRVSISIRRAPLSTNIVIRLVRSPSLAPQAMSHNAPGLTHANEIQETKTALTPVLYMPVGTMADCPW
jgi:hypothetical protein